jgi:pyruvate/2-oxoglutarate dehydrogenase complex dihydrolipoamide dehydrogenase (E3) component
VPRCQVEWRVGDRLESGEFDTVLVAAGREPATKALGLEEAGVKVRGRSHADDRVPRARL